MEIVLIFQVILILILGLVFGSFVTCISYRIPHSISFLKGRSFCPHCKHSLSWKENIPILSYVALGGRCRHCRQKISIRYPAIEAFVSLLFVVFFALHSTCGSYLFCTYNNSLGAFSLPFLLVNLVLISAIFVIDLEHQIIPDELVFTGFAFVFLTFLVFDVKVFDALFSAFLSSLLLLSLNLVTAGRGMGLGDVKFALYGGLFFSLPTTFTWLFMSFAIGAVVGVALIAIGKSKLGQRIPFGPFLAASLLLTLIIGNSFRPWALPF